MKVNWQQAKDLLNKSEFPADVLSFEYIDLGESHEQSKKHHALYHYRLKSLFNGYEMQQEYCYCNECKETRWSRATIFSEENGLCYQKWFIKGGRSL